MAVAKVMKKDTDRNMSIKRVPRHPAPSHLTSSHLVLSRLIPSHARWRCCFDSTWAAYGRKTKISSHPMP